MNTSENETTATVADRHTGLFLGPWGSPQSQKTIIPGMVHVTTAGHGGVCLSNEREALIPEYMRQSKHYEEDCDWALPFLVFRQEIEAKYAGKTLLGSTLEHIYQCAERTFRNWHPDAYEKFTGRALGEGESYRRDRDAAERRSAEKFVVQAAWGDHHPKVPEGMTAVVAQRKSDGSVKFFWVAADEYQNHWAASSDPFTIDPEKHREATDF